MIARHGILSHDEHQHHLGRAKAAECGCDRGSVITTLTIPDVDQDVADRLRARAAVHGRSVEAEARSILLDVLDAGMPLTSAGNIADAIRAIMLPIGGVDLEPFPNETVSEPPRFD